MLQQIDLRELAEVEGSERAVVSLYTSHPDGLDRFGPREERLRTLLAAEPAEAEHFEESLKMIREELAAHPVEGGVAIFASWALDFLVGYPLSVPVDDLLWVDSSPYIRPLAEMQSDYESFLAVSADNKGARIYLVSATVPHEVERIRADVKNHVKKGGWSQKRYQRRRDNELLHYGKEVAQALTTLTQKHGVERIVLFGSLEARREIRDALPEEIGERVVDGARRAGDGDDQGMVEEALELLEDVERDDEENLWERIRGELLRDGLAVAGGRDVLAAAQDGRIETLLVCRDAEIEGMRCRECELLAAAKPQQCPRCDSPSVFPIDLVNEIVELLAKTSAEAEFTDPIPGLAEIGGMAALLRY